jgi:hypothetical protein
MSVRIIEEKNRLWAQGKLLSEMLRGMAVSLQEALNDLHLATVRPSVYRAVSEDGKVGVLRISVGGAVIAELPDDEEGRRRLSFYRLGEPASEIPIERERRENALSKLAQAISSVVLAKGKLPTPYLAKLSKTLGGHPLAPFARTLANLPVSPDMSEFMGWPERPKEVPAIGRKNILVIVGKDCPHSKNVLRWLNMKFLEKEMFPRGIAVMLFETDEDTAGVEQAFGAMGTPAFIFCDVYFNVRKVIAGELSEDRFLREAIYYE